MAPAPSTITAILRRHGEPVGAHGGGRADWTRFEQPRPNALWQMDHKGHVAMADGRGCIRSPCSTIIRATPWC